ncbi:MAG: bifunctional folylpolyglutamate synthase/dihydrofolate synthase [Candidatus Omnitrophica bacterium]|nr:bifunctional folylpolyglutamate synthase/dihydrofolate synthase [Candidatus Omnitrophota bacterium]
MTYLETIQYIESFINYEKISIYPYKESLKLERLKEFLKRIDNPQVSLRCIHIAGTKGKGSTCAFIAHILCNAGYNVGLYTSPHLSDFRERIRILGHNSGATAQTPQDFEGMISKEELVGLVEELKPQIEKYNKESKYGPLSFFEVYTALSFVYFKEKKVDFAVLETGLGGRLDATNVIDPSVCAITPISYEHTQKLGNTLAEIATEKAGIIKVQHPESRIRSRSSMSLSPQSPNPTLIVISAPQEKAVIEVIRNRCKETGAKLYEIGKDIFYEESAQGFSVMGIFEKYPNLEIKLLGKHQLINATVAIGVIEALRFYNIIVNSRLIREGLYNTAWPGRCEIISRNPLIILDGAQNVASAKAIKETIKENFRYKRLFLVLGISKDKDIKGVCNELNELADEIILTRANNPRAAEPKTVANYFDGGKVHLTENIRESRKKINQLAGKEDLVLITGSLFVVGEARECWGI